MSVAFLDEDEDAVIDEEPRLTPLVPRSVQAIPPATISLVRQSLPNRAAPGSSASIYLGLGIGSACALFLGAALLLFLRSDGARSASAPSLEADEAVVVGNDHR